MVPKPGSFDESLFLDEKTGRFRFPKYPQSTKYAVEIRDLTDYRDQYWNHLDRGEKLQYDLGQFNRDIQSGKLMIEVDGFVELFKSENHKKFGQPEMFFHLDPEALLEMIEAAYGHSSPEPMWLTPSDPAYEAVKDSYLERAKQVELCDCWQSLKVTEIKEACKAAGIIVGNKKKEELIRELIERNVQYPQQAALPYYPTTKCYEALRGAISQYIKGIKENADRFHPTYIAHIWDAAVEANSYEYVRRAIREAIRDQYWLERMQPG